MRFCEPGFVPPLWSAPAFRRLPIWRALLLLLVASSASAQSNALEVPSGFVVERVAGPPLVERPMLAGFDDRGRLYVTDSSGVNLPGDELLKNPPHNIRRLEDTDGDGIFDKGTVFADKMVFPQGVVWHNGSVYVSSPPNFWRLQDNDDDGVADTREILASGFALSGISDDMHGGSLGPDGRIYWFAGRLPHEIRNREGTLLHKGRWPLMLRCRPDGDDLEIVSGVHGNCVGAAFTPEGEPFASGTFYGTMGIGLRDAIIHCVDGAEYPVLDLGVSNEHKHTGELMPALAHFGVAAASGLAIYRGDSFGPNFQGNLFSALFNMHRVVRHVLERDGATFKSRDEDFLTSSDPDFHPTDVIEDADGSLLVVDTGAWFLIGCPTSQISKPDAKGAIYRIRRQDAPPMADPRGQRINWTVSPRHELALLLGNPRFAVRERAIQQLATRGNAAMAILEETLQKSLSSEARRNAVWTLTRINSEEARAAARIGLNDMEASVRQTAARSVGLHRDPGATSRLMELVRTDTPPVRREAATSLGRIGRAEAVPALLEGLRGGGDRFLEHALIFALIQINDNAGTSRGLSDTDSAVRRGALIALDQMDDGDLKPEVVMPFLEPADPAAQKTALWVIANHPQWARQMLGFFAQWLDRFDELQGDALKQQLLAFSEDPAIQEFIAQRLHYVATPIAARLVLLDTIAQAPLNKLPANWGAELAASLGDHDERVVRQTVATLRSVSLRQKPLLRRIDRQIDFAPTSTGFAGTKLARNFFVRWTGVIQLPREGDYRFAIESNDGSRLFVDGQQIVENGGLHPMRLAAGGARLRAGEYPIKVEFFQGEGEAGCKALWAPPAAALAIIPSTVLFHRISGETSSAGNAPEPGLVGEYFDMSNEIPGFRESNALIFEAPLRRIASDASYPIDLRVEALAAAAPLLSGIDEAVFSFLLSCLEAQKAPLVRMTAAGVLSRVSLQPQQVLAVARALPTVGALEISKLLTVFRQEQNGETGKLLLAALAESPALESIRSGDLRSILQNYPRDIQQSAEPLLDKLAGNAGQQKARLAELQPVLQGGDAPEGRELFFNKAACFACHSVNGAGGQIGPDLSQIGAIRSGPDLLEAIVYPSASFARGFEPCTIQTHDDEVRSGMIRRETADAIYFHDGALVEKRILRSAVKEIWPGTISSMPEGLEAQLSPGELSNLIAFLLSLQ